MKISNNKRIEEMMKIQLMNQVIKSTIKGSGGFNIMMESLLNASMDENSKMDLNDLSERNLKNLDYTKKEKLDTAIRNIESNISSGKENIDKVVSEVSRKFNIDRDLIMAVIKQESDFQPHTVSSAGAMGLMQLMPDTAKYLGVSNPYNTKQNINGGTKYLKDLLNMYGNRKELALAAYNAGPGTLQNRGVKNVEDIKKLPYETRDYVKKVMKYYGK